MSSHDDLLAEYVTEMRCLIIVPSLLRAGAETQAIDLANGLAARGHHVHLGVLEPRLDQVSRVNSLVQVHKFDRRGKFDRSLISALAHLIDAEGVQVVQGVMQFATLYGWRASIRSRCRPPVIATIHTTVNVGLKEELQDRLLYRHMLRKLQRVVFVCKSQRAHWIEKYPELGSISEVVYNGVNPAAFIRSDYIDRAHDLRKKLQIPENAPVFSCIAAFRPEKNHELLLNAFTNLPSDTHLILAGDGERRQAIEQRVKDAAQQDRVHFLGNVQDVRPVIVAADATVLTSTAVETFSMAMLESMALGVPMIAPRIGGLSEAIEHGTTGLLFPVGDLAALTECLKKAAADRASLARLGSSGERLVASQFSLQQMVIATEAIYHSAIARR